MEYIFYSFRSLFCCALIVEFIGTGLVIWGIRHEEKLAQIEDKLINLFLEKTKSARRAVKSVLLGVIRKVFLFFYIPIRKRKLKLCRKWLREYGFVAVRADEGSR